MKILLSLFSTECLNIFTYLVSLRFYIFRLMELNFCSFISIILLRGYYQGIRNELLIEHESLIVARWRTYIEWEINQTD
jgi:hypothetical protein